MNTFRILGIDPGSLKTGWGAIESDGRQIRFLGCGVARTTHGATLPDRLLEVTREIGAVLDEVGYCDVVIEDVFLSKNVRSALILGHARGALLMTAAEKDHPIYEYTTAMIKRSVTGNGRANKTQISRTVQSILKLNEIPQEDAADALAAALTHAQKKMQQIRLIRPS